MGCKELLSISIPDSVKKIDMAAFCGCSSIKSIRIPSTTRIYYQEAFLWCFSLESIQLHQQVPCTPEELGMISFEDCVSLQIAYIPSAVLIHSHANELSLFPECNPNLILLSDGTGNENDDQDLDIPSICLNNVEECIDVLPEEVADLPANEQLLFLQLIVTYRLPHIAERTSESKLSLLHILIYFPGDIYEPLSHLLEKCPHATTAIDNNGKTPLHHVITSTRHNMEKRCYDLLVQASPDTVVHEAARARIDSVDDMKLIARLKINSLAIQEEESRLLPFMIAAQVCEEDNDVCGLSNVYELLSMMPQVLKEYDDS